MTENSGQNRDGEKCPNPGGTKINRLDSPMPYEEILLLDEVEDGPSDDMKNSAKSGSHIRRQPGIASGWRRWKSVSHRSNREIRRDRRSRQVKVEISRA